MVPKTFGGKPTGSTFFAPSAPAPVPATSKIPLPPAPSPSNVLTFKKPAIGIGIGSKAPSIFSPAPKVTSPVATTGAARARMLSPSSQPAGTFGKNPILQQFVSQNPVLPNTLGTAVARDLSTRARQTPSIFSRITNALTAPTAFAPATPRPRYDPRPMFQPTPPPSQGFTSPSTESGGASTAGGGLDAYAGGPGSGGSSSGGGGGGGNPDAGLPPTRADEECEDDYEGDQNDAGGYSEYGGGDPADTFAHDELAMRRTEALNPSDVDPHSPQSDYAPGPYSGNSYLENHGTGNELDYTAGLGGYDHDDDEDAGGQDLGSIVSNLAPSGQEESWNWRDRGRTPIPPFMYDAPRDRPGGEEGDDSMDAGDYIAALNGFGDAAGDAAAQRAIWASGQGLGPKSSPSAGDFFTQFGKDVGVSAAQGALTNLSKALGGGTKKVDVLAPPPMSTAAKIAIAVAVGIPIVYILTRTKSAPAPLTVHNPRRRRRR